MTLTAIDIQLYEILKQKLGNKEAEALVEFVDSRIKENQECNSKNLVTKEDLKDVDLKLKDVELRLSLKISETKTDIIRWLFAFLVPLLLAILGLYLRK